MILAIYTFVFAGSSYFLKENLYSKMSWDYGRLVSVKLCQQNKVFN